MLTLIEGGEVYAPEPRGVRSVLLLRDRIAQVGPVDRDAVERLGLDLAVVDARGCVVAPGFIDPHMHFAGGSGEMGFASRSPGILMSEIVATGTTTVVGTLGADTTSRTMEGLLADAKRLQEDGLTVFVYTGGYHIPPATLTGSVRSDMMLIREVIGAGEIAVSDHRSPQPDPDALIKIIVDAHVGGTLSGKAGVTHFHIGEGRDRLAPIRDLLERYEIQEGCLYLTHVERSEALMDEAIELAKTGAYVDVDTAEPGIARWLSYYAEHGGDFGRLTLSSDADSIRPSTLYEEMCRAVVEHGWPLERVLPLVTANTARVLKLPYKGRLEPGCDADVVVMRKGGLEVVDVFARGRGMVRNGEVVAKEKFLAQSNRRVVIHGEKD